MGPAKRTNEPGAPNRRSYKLYAAVLRYTGVPSTLQVDDGTYEGMDGLAPVVHGGGASFVQMPAGGAVDTGASRRAVK